MERKTFGRKNNSVDFLIKSPQVVVDAIKIYCETIEIKPEQFIKDAIVKDLIHTYGDLQSEQYIYVGDKYPEVKKPLKMWLGVMKLAIENNR